MTAMLLETPQDVYGRLMAARRGDPVEETLARILTSWSLGFGAMPAWLGLGEYRFRELMRRHFPEFDPCEISNPRRSLDLQREEEMLDLRELLMENRTLGTESEAWMADIVIAGCLGNDHLWQDLGLWSRSDLSKLMLENFEPLARCNDKDMKWKKFLYKKLCETEGIYTCRAPSCEQCDDFENCFCPQA